MCVREPRSSRLTRPRSPLPAYASFELAALNELVAQLVEQRPFKAWVLGSNPSELTTRPGRNPTNPPSRDFPPATSPAAELKANPAPFPPPYNWLPTCYRRALQLVPFALSARLSSSWRHPLQCKYAPKVVGK